MSRHETGQERAERSAAVQVENLCIEYNRFGERTAAVRNVSFQIMPGEVFGIVGESGSGKSTVAYSMMRYLASNAKITAGTIKVDGADLMSMSMSQLRSFRGAKAAMVFQDPTSALNPSIPVGRQIAEVFKIHSSMSKTERDQAVRESLEEVRFTDTDQIIKRYPYQLSGGQQQRICIAMALASEPDLLVLDEPTTGLDLSVQAQVLKLLHHLQQDRGMAMLYISHDLATVRRFCSRVGIMREGQMVEQDAVGAIFESPKHPYTAALLQCIPTAQAHKSTVRLKSIAEHVVDGNYFDETADMSVVSPVKRSENAATQVLCVSGLSKRFGHVVAANGAEFGLEPGEVLGIVGESGSGKSTLARLVAGLTVPDSGEVRFKQKVVAKNIANRSLDERRGVQMVFQRPDTTLNPILSVRATLQRSIDRLKGKRSAAELMREVKLDPMYLEYSPKRLSGGMKQRVAIARALAGGAEVLICDEATSALDPSIQSAILNQIVDLAAKRDTAIIFISHDLDAVRYVSDRIMVVYRGDVVETGDVHAVLDDPQHEYTRRLVNSSVESIDWDTPI